LDGVYVDGKETSTFPDNTTISIINSGTSTFYLDNLNATSSIKLHFSDETTSQLLLGGSVTYNKIPTYTKPSDQDTTSVHATCAFNSISSNTFTFTDEGAFSVAGVTLGSKLNYKEVITYNGVDIAEVKPTEQVTSANADATISFSLTPKSGISFVPTSVSFKAAKLGTGDNLLGKVTMKCSIKKGTTETVLIPSISPNRISGSFSSYSMSEYYIPYIPEMVTNSDNPCTLVIYVMNLAADDKKFAALSDVTINGFYYGEAQEETTYEVTTSVTPENAGTITQNPGSTSVLENSKVTFTANANTGYEFVKWTDGNGTTLGTEGDKTYTIDALSNNVTVQAVFKPRPTVIYTADSNVEGIVPDQVFVSDGETVTLPVNTTLYKEGYSFIGWSDGTTTYDEGTTLTLKDGDEIKLTATFKENDTPSFEDWITSAERTSVKVLNWTFKRSSNAPILNYENKYGVYTIRTTYDGKTIDMPMKIETRDGKIVTDKRGKLNNTSDEGKAQVNVGTRFSVPVSQNAIVTVGFSAGSFEATVDDKEKAITNKSLTYVYTGSESKLLNIDITSVSGTLYLTGVSVTYQPNTVTISSINAATLCLPLAVKIPEEGVKAYTGELSDNTLTLTQVEGVIPAEEAVILVGEAGSYKFEVSSEAGTKDTKNDLVGNSTSSPITPSVTNATVCVLDKVNDQLGFYKWEGKIPAYKAYLAVPTATTTTSSSSSAPAIRVIFNDEPGNVTAIESVAAERDTNAPIYTLSGRRVKNAVAPGLYIQGGKKFEIK
jgi:hypothetical protein